MKGSAIRVRFKAWHWLSMWLVSWSISVFCCDLAVDPLGPRFRIHLFDYGGASTGEAQNQHTAFQAVMKNKVIVWGEELAGIPSSDNSLPDVSLVLGGTDTLASASALKAFWRSTHALEVVRGILQPKPPNGYAAYSRVYLGDLQGQLKSDSVTVTMRIAPEEMANAVDAHSVITYFSLAMDLERRKCSPAQVTALLTLVQEKLHDLRRRGALDPALQDVAKVTDKALASLPRQQP
jgi:hypothetical protein